MPKYKTYEKHEYNPRAYLTPDNVNNYVHKNGIDRGEGYHDATRALLVELKQLNKIRTFKELKTQLLALQKQRQELFDANWWAPPNPNP